MVAKVGTGTGTKRLRRTDPREFEAKLAEIASKAPPKERVLGGFEQLVPSARYDDVCDEYKNRLHGERKRR